MGRIQKLTALALGVSLSCSTTPEAPARAPDRLDVLSWLAGSWEGAGAHSYEETWTPPKGSTMFGIHRELHGSKTLFYEYLRIEARDEGITYLASPLGRQPPDAFRMKEIGHDRVVFEDPLHDFPQRIGYARKGPRLEAWIEGVEGGEPRRESWTFQLAPVETR
ncbi:MAG: hypothetical protein HY791_19325 [Deltaproteobacteria bacterium]|nr:hypothetical protein [Deltaproteobacteria bacterium]